MRSLGSALVAACAAAFFIGAVLAVLGTLIVVHQQKASFVDRVRGICADSDGQFLVAPEGYPTCLVGQ